MSNNVISVNGELFASVVLESPKPVLVDFWAPWCGPCRGLAPTIGALAERYGDALRVVKVNVDEAPTMLAAHAIRAVPTLILFRNGAEQERFVGAADAAEIAAMIDRHIAPGADA